MKILEIETEKRKLGNFGEAAAVKFLKKNGYRIVERNYVAGEHEIDIVAENKDTVAFVEVKTRTVSTGNGYEARPAAAVTREKQKSIIIAASAYISYHAPKKHCRLDIIEVYVSAKDGRWKIEKINHMPAAFDKTSAFKPPYIK